MSLFLVPNFSGIYIQTGFCIHAHMHVHAGRSESSSLTNLYGRKDKVAVTVFSYGKTAHKSKRKNALWNLRIAQEMICSIPVSISLTDGTSTTKNVTNVHLYLIGACVLF